jgi:MerR family transcriptional regulator/heat shock protein HspR
MIESSEPIYIISVAAAILDVHPQTLRYYERAGLVQPSRSRGNIRLYSQEDIDRLRLIQRLMSDLGVNLAGVEVILNMTEHIEELEAEVERLQAQLEARKPTRG